MSKTVAETVCELVADELGWDISDVTPNADLEIDLGADSLDKTELAITMEEQFEIEILDEEINHIKTVKDVIELVEKKLKK